MCIEAVKYKFTIAVIKSKRKETRTYIKCTETKHLIYFLHLHKQSLNFNLDLFFRRPIFKVLGQTFVKTYKLCKTFSESLKQWCCFLPDCTLFHFCTYIRFHEF